MIPEGRIGECMKRHVVVGASTMVREAARVVVE